MSAPARRLTPQKIAVRDALRSVPGFVGAQTLHAILENAGSRIGLATVYRALNELAEVGGADTVQTPTGETLFRGCATAGHHHHLVCRRCGTTVEVHSDAVEEWARAAAREHGFTDVGHVLDIYGVCVDCSSGTPRVTDSPPSTQSG